MKHLLLLLLISQFVFSNVLQTEELSVFDKSENKILEKENKSLKKENKNKKEYKEHIVEKVAISKTLYSSYLSYPKFVYQKQRFEVNIKTIVTRNKFQRLEVRFVDSKNITILNPHSNWKVKKNSEFVNKFYFKINSKNFVMPKIQILLYLKNKVIEVSYLNPLYIKYQTLGLGNKKFSKVIAKDLKLISFKTKQYNNKELLTVLELTGENANLEDFVLSENYKEQGITFLKEYFPSQSLIYHVIIPIHTRKISFNYYNTDTKRFKNISFAIDLKNDLVSTQTDLNPSNSNFEFYKKTAIAIIVLLLLILTIWKRKVIFLIFTLIFLIILIIYIMPNKTIILSKNVVIYILPTKNSTIFHQTNKEQVVEILNQKAGFYKVLFNTKNNTEIIGWIKEKDVIKN
ncbi:MAG: hypothetical protein HRT40_04045 [Campylobacteraceae bacterium]|nr:hypothetical protein [Campylobacteraceae bacterium]